jgi:para-nitrobenzyl esterase
MDQMPDVRITPGIVAGSDDDGIAVFRGIPYAQPPLGELRFRAPVRPDPWVGALDARRFGPTAPQQMYANQGGLPDVPEPIISGDAFLNLNVWSPDLSGRAPVLVWIHGGGYTAGSSANPWYDGTSFARQGLVVVSINYRLGAEGMLRLPDADENNSLRDWIAALEWVRDEISRFGGDPQAVTVLGQSAGGLAVGTLLTSPAAEGLFHRAIIASGVTTHSVQTEAHAADVAQRFCAILGVEPRRQELVAISPDELVRAQNALAEQNSLLDSVGGDAAESELMPWVPVIDGDLVVGTFLEGVAAGRGSRIPVLVGTTENEFRWVGIRSLPGDEGRRAGQRLADSFFRRPTQQFVEARRASSAPTFRYEFRWRSQVDPDLIGSGHSIDIPFFFNTLDAPYFAGYAGQNPPAHLAESMHGSFARFAMTGDPGWPEEREAGGPTMVFDDESRVESGVTFED